MFQKSAQLFGAVLQAGAVICEQRRPDDGAYPAFMDGGGDELVLAAKGRPVHLLEQAFLAAERQFLRLDLYDVPVGIAAFDLGAQRADAAVPTVFHQLVPVFLENGSK